jgi:hypothetical protein
MLRTNTSIETKVMIIQVTLNHYTTFDLKNFYREFIRFFQRGGGFYKEEPGAAII